MTRPEDLGTDGFLRSGFQQRLAVGFGILPAGKCHVHIQQSLRAAPPSKPVGGLEVKQDLPLRHPPYGCCISVAGCDEGGIDVRPARCALTASAALARSMAQRM